MQQRCCRKEKWLDRQLIIQSVLMQALLTPHEKEIEKRLNDRRRSMRAQAEPLRNGVYMWTVKNWPYDTHTPTHTRGTFSKLSSLCPAMIFSSTWRISKRLKPDEIISPACSESPGIFKQLDEPPADQMLKHLNGLISTHRRSSSTRSSSLPPSKVSQQDEKQPGDAKLRCQHWYLSWAEV